MKYFVIYLAIINAMAFMLMLIDKIKAKKKLWRIPERVLLGVSAIGGSLGGLIGMRLFRHKTKHPQFFVGIPVMLVIHIVALVIYFIMK